jgi:hypothetical protein
LARRFFLRLCVAIFIRLRFFPDGMEAHSLSWYHSAFSGAFFDQKRHAHNNAL